MRLIRLACLASIITFIVILLPLFPGHPYDTYCWKEWALYIKRNGLGNVYQTWTDYLPLYHYLLWFYDLTAGTEKAIEASIGNIRIYTLLFDVLGLWFVYKWIDRKVDFVLIVVMCLLNIGYTYNTVIWGQVDGILTTLSFIALYYGFHNKAVLSSLFFVLAINFKLQAIVFLPLWGLLCINTVISFPRPKNFVLPLLCMLALQAVVIIPFAGKGLAEDVWRVAVNSVDRYPVITIGAKNFWSFVFDGQSTNILDSGIWLAGLTYKQGGLYMFFAASFIVLLPMIIRTIKRLRKPMDKTLKLEKEQIWLTASLLVMLFYFLNTQMHERYVQPAIIFIAAYAFHTRNGFPLVLFSVANLLNLEDELRSVRVLSYDAIIFNDIFIATLYLLTIIYLGAKLFQFYYSGLKQHIQPHISICISKGMTSDVQHG